MVNSEDLVAYARTLTTVEIALIAILLSLLIKIDNKKEILMEIRGLQR